MPLTKEEKKWCPENTSEESLVIDLESAWSELEALRAELDAAKAANATLEAQRDEARELVRRSSGMRSRSLEAIIAKWDAERSAPDTNRDAGDEREEQ